MWPEQFPERPQGRQQTDNERQPDRDRPVFANQGDDCHDKASNAQAKNSERRQRQSDLGKFTCHQQEECYFQANGPVACFCRWLKLQNFRPLAYKSPVGALLRIDQDDDHHHDKDNHGLTRPPGRGTVRH